jgi:tRNA threonylcarbamoyladenosine biosynthesis protein TsaE
MISPKTIISNSEQETFDLGEKLARGLPAGTFVLLHGDLGSGKTSFVRGMAAGLGLDPGEVSSPTFVLVQHYRGSVPLTHADLYRLETATAVDDLGLEEMAGGGVVAIEWAERLPRAFEGSVSVKIEDLGGDTRRISIEPGTPHGEAGTSEPGTGHPEPGTGIEPHSDR